MKKVNKGFTLVEILVAVAILGILAAVGYPSYASYVKKAQRADAIHALLVESGRLEEFYLNSDTYDGAAVASTTSPEGYYTIALSDETAFGYLLTATRSPDNDPECTTLTYDQLGVKAGENTFCWE